MEILETIREICLIILPILGALALVIVIILLIKLIKTLKNANKLLTRSEGTVDLVDESIKKVQAPLDSVVKVSHTVDVAHDATIKGLGEAKDFIAKNAEVIKGKINEFTKKEDEEDYKSNPNNTIGG